jgi:isocitrate/isopropylmalate dehydrogenase
MKIAVAKGDGIGPEIMDAVLKIFDANQVPLEYEMVEMGKWVFDKGFNNGMTPEAKQAIETLGLLYKGPMETPKGKGVKSINVTARKTWNTYANKIPYSARQAYLSILPWCVKILKIPTVVSSTCLPTTWPSAAALLPGPAACR